MGDLRSLQFLCCLFALSCKAWVSSIGTSQAQTPTVLFFQSLSVLCAGSHAEMRCSCSLSCPTAPYICMLRIYAQYALFHFRQSVHKMQKIASPVILYMVQTNLFVLHQSITRFAKNRFGSRQRCAVSQSWTLCAADWED